MTFEFKGTIVLTLDLDPAEYAGLTSKQTIWAIQELLSEVGGTGTCFDTDDIGDAADALSIGG